jgi:WD repeat-containing protein 24
VRVEGGKITEEYNLRSSITSYASAHASPRADSAEKRREYLPARDVKWSINQFDHVIATAGNNGRIALYNLQAPSARTEWAWLHEHTGQINKLDIDPHVGYLLLSASQDKSVRLWDLRETQPTKSRSKFDVRGGARDVRWSPLEPFDFAVCTDAGTVQKWDIRSPMLPKLSINAHEKSCYSIDYHPDGRHVISGGADKHLRVWDLESDRKRQKPVLQLKAAHAIRSVRWRPPCHTSESRDGIDLQSTQVAVSYHHDDPRIHIWDLRRPMLPFRDLDRYNSAPNDMLWAGEDMLWTVADDGVLTQWDVRHIPPYENQISLSTSTFMPDGDVLACAEDRTPENDTIMDDPSLGFMSVPRDKLSSDDNTGMNMSPADDDPGSGRRSEPSHRPYERTYEASVMSKSQANSPPSVDGMPHIMPLPDSMHRRPAVFTNHQVVASDSILGLAADLETVRYLASHYASPATADENSTSPATILQRLEAVFQNNASACEKVSMHRMAQCWRILATVIVPELRDWADKSRASRRTAAARRKETLMSFQKGQRSSVLSPLAGLPTRGYGHKEDVRGIRELSVDGLLKRDMVRSERSRDPPSRDNTSHMTTPLARPLPRSPRDSERKSENSNFEDGLDGLMTLPPSLLTSHSTAAAASQALLPSPDRQTQSSASSLETSRLRESKPATLDVPASPLSSLRSPRDNPQLGSKLLRSPPQTDEERRAAIRNFRAPTRPIFSLGDSTAVRKVDQRTSSSESFPMFSVSTDSSGKVPSAVQSFDTPALNSRYQPQRTDSDLSSDQSELVATPAQEYASYDSIPAQPTRNGTHATHTGNEAIAALKLTAGYQSTATLHESKARSQVHTTVSTSPEIFPFDEHIPASKLQIHTSNPVRALEQGRYESLRETRIEPSKKLTLEELDTTEYLFEDFQPIDLSCYEPKLPFAWSALPLICQCIAFDLENGIGHAQFAAHLLMHVHPYFFHPSHRSKMKSPTSSAENIVERLMIPSSGHRVIEGILTMHISYIQGLQLFESAAAMRKMALEMGYPSLYRSTSADTGVSDVKDAWTISVACSTCQAPLLASQGRCERCQEVRAACPICESFICNNDLVEDSEAESKDKPWKKNSSLWTFCQSCGHSGHVICLTEWFKQVFSEGICPTPGCDCDCTPGEARNIRLQQHHKKEEDAKLIRHSSGTGNTIKRDPVAAMPSAAVDKARVALRNSFASERGTQSGDERSLPGKRNDSRRTSGFNASRKSVRLVTPGEEG